MDLGGPLTPPVVRTTPTVVVVTPTPISTPTVLTVPTATTTSAQPEAASAAGSAPLNLGAAGGDSGLASAQERPLGDIAAQYRRKDGTQSASRVYTNEDIARLNRERTRDHDLPMSDVDEDDGGSKTKTVPVPPRAPR
jgi:hypothetical protein